MLIDVRHRLLASSVLALFAHAGLAIAMLGGSHGLSRSVTPIEPGARGELEIQVTPMPLPALAAGDGRGSAPATSGPKARAFGPPRPARASAAVVATASSVAPIVEGIAPSFAGGFTTSRGLSDLFVGDPDAADALLYGKGSGGGGAVSTPPRIGGYVDWDCPWPDEAPRTDHAIAHVTVDVTARGEPVGAKLVDDPGSGFGPRAIRCAMEAHYIPGHDGQGRPVAGRTRPFAVRFDRTRSRSGVAVGLSAVDHSEH
ncbi:MAG: hypothetical protein ABSC94_05225 [Polyangiaceae bacterium]|jgi:hypothetical protein